MKKLLLILAFLLSVLCMVVLTSAFVIPANDRAKEVSQAPEHSPAIGENYDIERIDFIHYVRPTAPAKKVPSSTCYKLMGVKWLKDDVHYTINPANEEGISPGTVSAIIATSAETWDKETSKALFDNTYSTSDTAAYGTYDGTNAISFGSFSDNSIIAVTSVWYSRVGKQILEFDIQFNDYYNWGTTGDGAHMDLQNIATHELGHAVGMSDVYTDSCSAVTMYGYSWNGDTGKQTLELPDIAGLQTMYGL